MTSLITTGIFAALVVLTTFLIQHNPIIMANSISNCDSNSQHLFASKLLQYMVDKKSAENIVYSPASIHSSLALIYLGAKGQTDNEILQVLNSEPQKICSVGNLEPEDKTTFAHNYGEFLRKIFYRDASHDEDKPQLRVSSRLYVNNKIKLQEQFNYLAYDSFGAEAENIDFSQSTIAVDRINKWVEEQTGNKIKNLLCEDAVNGETTSIIVNAIYFKAKWLIPFDVRSTSKRVFHINPKNQIEVDTMSTEDDFGYAELDDLNAKVLEMPYYNSDISMMILLPNKIDGLKELESSLYGKDLNDISNKLVEQNVDVYLPKFRIEFEIDIKEALIKMGCPSMFSNNANLTGIFDSSEPQKVSDIKHKAFLDCNEAGSEAAAATYVKIVPMSLNMNKITFRADHPFIFVIRSKNAVYFSGHVAKF